MKIKKKDGKPMSIHQKAKPKIHVVERKAGPAKGKPAFTIRAKPTFTARGNAGLRSRQGKGTGNGTGVKTESALKDVLFIRKGTGAGYDIRGNGKDKFRKNSLKVMAASSAKKTLSGMDGGEEVGESLEVMGMAAAPLYGLQSQAAKVHRRAKEEKAEKAGGKQRSRKGGIRTEADRARSLHIRRKSVEAKGNGSSVKRDSGREGFPGRDGRMGKGRSARGQMLSAFLKKFHTGQGSGAGGLANSAGKQPKTAAMAAAGSFHSTLVPAFLAASLAVAVAGVAVLAVLASVYSSPLALLFPMPDTGYENPRTVLAGYYAQFNQKVLSLEEGGAAATFQNTEDGVPVSNFNDTLMAYMVKYGTGQAGFVMDEGGKRHLKEVFDEMNYMDVESSTVEVRAGESIGKVWATAYCPCAICCGKYANGITASGKRATERHTIAVDAYHPIVPMGTRLIIEGVEYTVEDTGDLNRYGNDIDVL